MSKNKKNYKKRQENINNTLNKKLNNIKEESTESEKPINKKTEPKTKAPIYIASITYFTIMAIICFVIFSSGNIDLANTLSITLFIGFIFFTFGFAKIMKYSWKTALISPIKILCFVAGFTFLLTFITNGSQYFKEINIQSQNVYDIENNTTKILEYGDITMYADTKNWKIITIDKSSEFNQISSYPLTEEQYFEKETLNMTNTFYDLSENLRFSYIVNNVYGEIVLQWTNNEKRYLSTISGNLFTKLLEDKDNISETILNTDKLRIYKLASPDLILSVTDDHVQLSEYDTVIDIEGLSYIERVYTFMTNHLDIEYIESQNASAELIAELKINDYKYNLYNIGCATCEYMGGMSEVMEIVTPDKSYIFNLNINSEILKEATINEK